MHVQYEQAGPGVSCAGAPAGFVAAGGSTDPVGAAAGAEELSCNQAGSDDIFFTNGRDFLVPEKGHPLLLGLGSELAAKLNNGFYPAGSRTGYFSAARSFCEPFR